MHRVRYTVRQPLPSLKCGVRGGGGREENSIPLHRLRVGERNENRLKDDAIRDQTGRENCLTRSLINYLTQRSLSSINFDSCV